MKYTLNRHLIRVCTVCLSWTEIHNNLENSTCDPLKYIMDSHIFIVSICIKKSTRIQMIKSSSPFEKRITVHPLSSARWYFSNTDISDLKIIFLFSIIILLILERKSGGVSPQTEYIKFFPLATDRAMHTA